MKTYLVFLTSTRVADVEATVDSRSPVYPNVIILGDYAYQFDNRVENGRGVYRDIFAAVAKKA